MIPAAQTRPDRRRGRFAGAALVVVGLGLSAGSSAAQSITQRGFVDGTVVFYPQEAANDTVRLVGDLIAREEVFVKPAAWVQFAGGLDARANTHDQVERSWRLDVGDRRPLRPALSVRRLSATVTQVD